MHRPAKPGFVSNDISLHCSQIPFSSRRQLLPISDLVSLCCSPAFNMCPPRPHYVPGPMQVWDGGWSVEYTDIRYRQQLREEISLPPFLQNTVTHSPQVEIRHLLFLQPYLIISRESWSTGHFTFNEAQPEKTRCCQCTGRAVHGTMWEHKSGPAVQPSSQERGQEQGVRSLRMGVRGRGRRWGSGEEGTLVPTLNSSSCVHSDVVGKVDYWLGGGGAMAAHRGPCLSGEY